MCLVTAVLYVACTVSLDKVVIGAKNDVSTTSKALHVDQSDSRSSGSSTGICSMDILCSLAYY